MMVGRQIVPLVVSAAFPEKLPYRRPVAICDRSWVIFTPAIR